MDIAILGWGSLLWDVRPEFDCHHGLWEYDGPGLMLEFSRVSRTRGNALTLVIDPENGQSCPVAYARSSRRNPEDAINDLRCREGTSRQHIGVYSANGALSQHKDEIAFAAISAWARAKAIDVVVWTDLQSNFKQSVGDAFSIASALAHIRGLSDDERAGAVEYVRRAPDFVRTSLRVALHAESWFMSSRV